LLKTFKRTVIRKCFAFVTFTILFSSIFLLHGFGQSSSLGILASKDLVVSFLDVGQADCILIHTPAGQNILIDAGNREDYPLIRSFLESQKIARLDIVIGTHPHEDHIGSMEQIVRSFDIGRIYMPKVATNTKVFKDLLMAIQAKGLKIIPAKAGVNIETTPELVWEFLAPISDSYENLNDYSAVVRLTYHKVSFLFTGDAERIAEQEMIGRQSNLRANVLKVGHHGSSSSSHAAFMRQVAPEVAVISVGINNPYHHPSLATMKRLERMGVQIYRTDLHGTIQVITDGNIYKVRCGRQKR
jgi:competence protein ComEC